MTEQEEETNKSKEEEERVLNMEFDIDDMENSWPLINHHHQQISTSPFVNSNLPMSPLLLSSSEQLPFSPLWAFSDADNYVDRFPSSSTPSYPIFLSCNTNSVTESRIVNDEINKIPSPLVRLMPVENTDGHCVIKERMTQALRYFIESTKQHVLAQVWVPVKKGGRSVLTTLGQPFVLDPHCNGLNQYRMVSVMYMFSTEGESDGELGLPGRVYRQKLPEWTPDVQYYSSKEYSRLDHALNYNVRGTLALPVFEPSMESCVGVLELIMTSQKINYAPEVDKVCKALEAVNLKSSEILDYPMAQICNEGRQNALAEILEILTVVCETHKLPLAQTWIPCMHGSVLANGGGLKKSCTSFDGRCHGQVCMSVTDVAFYVVDAHMWGFREACHEHHLKRGQGVAGRAFLSHHSCFCQDITQFCKTEYPLVHYARMFGLTSSFAICLRSSYTGDDDYILEFFLRPSITDHHEQKRLLGFIMATMKQHFQSLKVASGMDLEEEEGFVEIIEASTNERVDLRLECFPIPQSLRPFEDDNKLQNEGQRVELEAQNHQPNTVLDASESVRDILPANKNQISAPLPEKNGTKKSAERKRGKTEKTISLEVLQQYFSGSLKDAAKSLGVCPTTMKRICRQHGISRWPSRKINKVNRSLSKLKRVMESVQGADRAFGINHHITSAPIPVAVGSISWPSNVNGRNQQDPQNSRSPEFHSDKNGSPNCKSPGSNGQVGNEDQTVSGRILIQEEWAMQNGISPELGNHTNKYRTTSGSREESGGTPVSHGSCHGSPANDSTPAKKTPASPFNEPYNKSGGSPEILIPPIGQLGSTTSYSIPSPLVAVEAQATFGRMLIDDAGSSKDLRSLCPLPADGIVDERVPECCWPIPPCSDIAPTQAIPSFTNVMPDVRPRQETRSITIKATYKEDIIRFRVALNSGIVELKDEVAKRLKLEVGTFDIKYLDDDQEWVLIACDADLNECIDIARSSGSNAIRLSVHDVNTHLGSSCESTGEL